mgnify:CR=1 FL=1
MRQEKSSLLRNKGFQSLLASLLCIVLGLLIGYIVLLIINPAGAGEAIRTIVENFLYYPSAAARLRYLQHAGEDRAAADVQPVGAVRL